MTLHTGKGGGYRYYTCSIKAWQGKMGCSGRSLPMPQLDAIICDHIESWLLQGVDKPVLHGEVITAIMQVHAVTVP